MVAVSHRALHGAVCGLLLAVPALGIAPIFVYHAVPVLYYFCVVNWLAKRESVLPYAIFMGTYRAIWFASVVCALLFNGRLLIVLR